MIKPDNGRRLLGTRVTGQAMGALLRSGHKTISFETRGPIPESAIFYTSWWDTERSCWVVVFEDKSFSEVPEGNRIPISDMACTIIEHSYET